MDKTEPAFPQGMPEHGSMPGLSKREIFAAMAMQGFCSWDHNKGKMICDCTHKVSEAVRMADQLIIELAK